MGPPSAFLVISFLVLVACSLSAATRDFQKPFVKEKTVSETSQILKRPASVPLDFQPSEKRERTAGEEEFNWNMKYFTKDIIREPDNIYWHKNEKLHPMPQLSKEIVPEEKRGSTDGGEEFLRNKKYFTKDMIREPDNIYWHKNENLHPMPQLSKEIVPEEKRGGSDGGEEFLRNRKYFTKDIIREPDNIYWHKNENLHPMPQLSKEIVPEEKRGSTDGGEEFLQNRKYFTKDIIREPDNVYWQKNEKVHPMPETTKELTSHASAVSPGAQKIVENNIYFTKDLIREPDNIYWHKNGKP